MNTTELLSWGTVFTLVVTVFLLGLAPVFVVRLIAAVYPKGHPRRREIVGEMRHVEGVSQLLEQWRWLGETFGLALCEGLPARRSRRRASSGFGASVPMWRDDEQVQVQVSDLRASKVTVRRMLWGEVTAYVDSLTDGPQLVQVRSDEDKRSLTFHLGSARQSPQLARLTLRRPSTPQT